MPANLSISLKIFLIEDSIPGRGQLAALFGNINGVDVVGEAETTDAATSRVEVCGPAVAVMDFHLAQGTAMHVIAPVAESDRSLITIVLTNHATAIVREGLPSGRSRLSFCKTGEISLALATIGVIARNRSVCATETKGGNLVRLDRLCC
jgi:DNA-binding NarL/FixJ family response regulator